MFKYSGSIEARCETKSSRTDLDILVQMIEYEENLEKINTEAEETDIELREVEGCEETKQFEGEYDGATICQEPSGNSSLLEPEASPPSEQLSMLSKEDVLLSVRDLDQPIEARCEMNSSRTDLDILVEMLELEEMNTEYDESAICREPAGNSSSPFGIMESEVVPPVEQLSTPSRTSDREEKRSCDIWTTIVPRKLEQSCDFYVQSWKGTEKLPGLQENEVVATGELVELFNRACGVQETDKVEEMSRAKAANDVQHSRCTGARPKIKIWQNSERIRSDENWVEGDLMVCELDIRSAIPGMQVEAFRRSQYASTYETRNEGWNKVYKGRGWETRNERWNKAKKFRGDSRIRNENGAEQQVWTKTNDIGWGGCNGPGYCEGH